MAYLDPASKFGSKPQRLGATNSKSSTSDKLQTFRTIFGISCKFLTQKLFTWDNTFCFEEESHAREITEPFRKIRRRINDLRENVLYYWVHGRVEALLDEKVEIQLWNAVLLFSTTVYWEDAGSKIQFSLISVYKNWDIWPQSLDLGGSAASNEVNIRPQQQYLLFLTLKLPDFDD